MRWVEGLSLSCLSTSLSRLKVSNECLMALLGFKTVTLLLQTQIVKCRDIGVKQSCLWISGGSGCIGRERRIEIRRRCA